MTLTSKLSILDLVPISDGQTIQAALRTSLELVQAAESFGYHGYWFGEHHLGTGRVGAAPSVLAALALSRTDRIRVGSAVVVLSNYTALSLVEQFGSLAELYPGRVALGLGRGLEPGQIDQSPEVRQAVRSLKQEQAAETRVPALASSAFFPFQSALVSVPERDEIDDGRFFELLRYLDADVARVEGSILRAMPGYRAPLTPWMFGNAAGKSAVLAARMGLPFSANAHIITGTHIDAVTLYRQEFRPSRYLREPYVAVSTHVLAAARRSDAIERGISYPGWVSGVLRRGFPDPVISPAKTDPKIFEKDEAVGSALALRYLGEPAEVVDGLSILSESIKADELILNTVVFDPRHRLESYELIAKEVSQ